MLILESVSSALPSRSSIQPKIKHLHRGAGFLYVIDGTLCHGVLVMAGWRIARAVGTIPTVHTRLFFSGMDGNRTWRTRGDGSAAMGMVGHGLDG